MKLLKTLSLVALSLFVVSCGGKNQTAEITPEEEVVVETPGEYSNKDLGFELTFDPTLLVLAEEDSTHVLFKGVEGKAELRIFKDIRKNKNGENLAINDYYKQDEVAKPGNKHSLATFRSDYYIISGIQGTEVLFYQKSIYKGGGVLTAVLTYPKEEREVYNAHFNALFASFK